MPEVEIDQLKRARLMDIARRVAERAPFADVETARRRPRGRNPDGAPRAVRRSRRALIEAERRLRRIIYHAG